MRPRLVIPTTASGTRRHGGSAVADELRRLTRRDLWLLGLLTEHRTLTTAQITELGFGSADRARHRLNLLHSRGVLDRFRRYVWPGTQCWHWTVGALGAAVVAATAGREPPRPATLRDELTRLAASPSLAHLVGVNGFFVTLSAHARTRDGAELVRWWSERQATRECGGRPRPDAHGVWVEHGRGVPFWLEHDTGTERPMSRLSGKLGDYAALPRTLAYPVLFWLPSAVRESNLSAHLARTGIPAGVIVASAAADHAGGHGGPAGPVWSVAGHVGRLRLAELPVPAPYRPDRDGAAPWDE